jgi:hypothetical protein
LRDQRGNEGDYTDCENGIPHNEVGRGVLTALDKKTFIPDKSENEGIQRILSRTRGKGWPHPSLDGEVGPGLRDHDEHNQTDILTSGLTSLPPSRRSMLSETVARGSL